MIEQFRSKSWLLEQPFGAIARPHALKQNFLPKANGIHNTFIWEDDGNAYLIAVDDVDTRDVIIVDITKPASPKEITRVGAPDWPDLGFSEIEGPAVFLHDVWVQENGGNVTAYLSYWDAGPDSHQARRRRRPR